MTTTLEDLGSYMASNGRGTLGTDLFLNMMPDSPDSVTSITEYLSGQPLDTMGAHAPLVELPMIQVLVRRGPTEYLTARTEADLVYNLLVMILDTTIGSNRYTVTPTNTPTLTGRDEQKRPIVTCNYAVRRM